MFLKQCYKTNSLQIRDSDLKAVRGGESALAMAKRRYTTVHMFEGKRNTVVPGFSVLGFRALPGFRALCTGNQIWIYVINLPGFSALPGFKAPFHGDGQSALNPGTTVLFPHIF